MQSKFHRWWLGSCVAALLLASWAGGFSVAVTAVFVVIYLTGVTLVGSDEEADIGLAAEPAAQDSPAVPAPEPKAVPQPAPPSAEAVADHNADHDAQPYPDDGDEVEPASSAPVVVAAVDRQDDDADTTAVVVESGTPVDTVAVVEESGPVDTAAVVKTIATDQAETGALVIGKDPDGTEPSPA
jgi:hypothetical protein